jgi:hypothetical protein
MAFSACSSSSKSTKPKAPYHILELDLVAAYLKPNLAGANVGKEFLKLCGILTVAYVPNEQTHLLSRD